MGEACQAGEVPGKASAEGAITFEETLSSLLNEALTTIGATGGSVMLLDARREWLVIQARLGLPRPGRYQEPRFRVGETSIAGYVASSGLSYLCADVENDRRFAPARSGPLQFRSLLCVPIPGFDHVLGVINADHEEPGFFKQEDERWLCVLARRLSAIVQERAGLSRILDGLHSFTAALARLSPEGRLADVLQNIAEQAAGLLGADLVILYEYDQGRQLFVAEQTGPTIGGRLLGPEALMRSRVYPDDVPAKVVAEAESRYFEDVEGDNSLTGRVPARDGLPERPRFASREKIKSMAALVLRAGSEVVGLMFANYRSLHRFTEEEKRTLETSANYAAVAIKNARLLQELRELQEKRLAAERWVTVGKAVGYLAHRINNTLGVVPVAVQDLEELLAQLPIPIEHREQIEADLGRINRNTQFALELADVLLKPFKAGQARQWDVNTLINQAISVSSIPSTRWPSGLEESTSARSRRRSSATCWTSAARSISKPPG